MMVTLFIAYVIGALMTGACVVYVCVKDYGKLTVGDLLLATAGAILSWVGLLGIILVCLSKFTIYEKTEKRQ